MNELLIDRSDGVLTITLNRLEKKNSLTRAMYAGMAEALAFGILDQVIDDTADLKAAGIAMARAKADIRPLPRVRDRTAQIAEYQADPGMFDAMRKSIARKARNQKAPYNCIAAVEAACTLPFDQGVLREQELFLELENSDEARALKRARTA